MIEGFNASSLGRVMRPVKGTLPPHSSPGRSPSIETLRQGLRTWLTL